mmetsp:Transcript_36855/g.66808  ORF Transcript_36855/g.66808 Transcript_36855/m.66808 type:complete len:230 (+) Transcript_36855:273-962(+)
MAAQIPAMTSLSHISVLASTRCRASSKAVWSPCLTRFTKDFASSPSITLTADGKGRRAAGAISALGEAVLGISTEALMLVPCGDVGEAAAVDLDPVASAAGSSNEVGSLHAGSCVWASVSPGDLAGAVEERAPSPPPSGGTFAFRITPLRPARRAFGKRSPRSLPARASCSAVRGTACAAGQGVKASTKRSCCRCSGRGVKSTQVPSAVVFHQYLSATKAAPVTSSMRS